jgi:hypothetical protein
MEEKGIEVKTEAEEWEAILYCGSSVILVDSFFVDANMEIS